MYEGRMSGFYEVCFLVLVLISKSMGATLGRASDIETNQRDAYPNNPFLSNSSFPEGQSRHVHYPGYHHHHDFYHYHNHNHNKWPNSRDNDQENHSDNFMEQSFPSQIPEGPKTTSRRQTTDDEVPNYPFADIRSFLNKNALLKQYFAELPQIGNRDGAPEDEDGGESLCKMQVIRTYYPKTLKNINNIERIVVNDDQDYKQAVEQTRCANAGRQCNIPFDAFGYTSECHQNFDNKRLMVYENTTKSVVFDEFKVPSCCVCKVKKVQ